jgi:hypothetical protein
MPINVWCLIVQTFDANLTVKLFDAEVVADASKDMESSYF